MALQTNWSPQISERYPILNETIQKYTNEIIVERNYKV